MLTELFLLAITLSAAFVKFNEKPAALIYCATSYMFYLIGSNIYNEAYVYQLAAICSTVLIALLVCVHGCARSSLTKYLIPLALASIVMHFYGWTRYINNYPIEVYNQMVVTYWCIVIGLFLTVGRRSGDIAWYTRFLGNTNHRNNVVDSVFK